MPVFDSYEDYVASKRPPLLVTQPAGPETVTPGTLTPAAGTHAKYWANQYANRAWYEYPGAWLGSAAKWTLALADRPFQTALTSLAGGNRWGDIIPSIWDPERATTFGDTWAQAQSSVTGRSVEAIRAADAERKRKRLEAVPAGGWGYLGEALTDWQNWVDLAGTLATSPSTYMTGPLALLGKGKAAQHAASVGMETMAAKTALTGVERAAKVLKAETAFTKATGKSDLLERLAGGAPPGMEATYAERLAAGEQGFGLHIPFVQRTWAGIPLTPINKALAPAMRMLAKPGAWLEGSGALGRAVKSTVGMFLNPEVESAAGQGFQRGKGAGPAAAGAMERQLLEGIMPRVQALEAIDPRLAEAVTNYAELAHGVDPFTGSIFVKNLKTWDAQSANRQVAMQALETVQDVIKSKNLGPDAAADLETKVQSLAMDLAQFGEKNILAKLAEYGVPLATLGSALRRDFVTLTGRGKKLAAFKDKVLAARTGEAIPTGLPDLPRPVGDIPYNLTANDVRSTLQSIRDLKRSVAEMAGDNPARLAVEENIATQERKLLGQPRPEEMSILGATPEEALASTRGASLSQLLKPDQKALKELWFSKYKEEVVPLVDEKIAGVTKELDVLANKLQELPAYLPHMRAEDLELAKEEAARWAAKAGTATKKRTTVYGQGGPESWAQPGAGNWRNSKGELVDMDGVPLSRVQAEAYYKEQGFAAGGFKELEREPTLAEAVKRGFRPEALKDLAKKDATYYEKDVVKGYAKKIIQSGGDVSRAQVRNQYVNWSKSLTHDSWNTIKAEVKKAAEGAEGAKSWPELEALFKKELQGTDLQELLPPQLRGGLATDAQRIEALAKRDAPYGLRPTSEIDGWHTDTPGEWSGYLPIEWANQYAKRSVAFGSQLARTAGMAFSSYQVFNNAWRWASTVWAPAFHTRNAGSDLGNMAAQGLLDARSAADAVVLIKDFYNGYMKDGWRFEKMTSLVPVGESGAKLFGAPQVRLGQVVERLVQNGFLSTGQVKNIVADAHEMVFGATRKNLASRAGMGTGFVDRMKRFLFEREDIEKVMGVLTRLRAGDTLSEAMVRTQRALYDFTSISPAAQVLRQTGVAPFIAWTAKNVPAQFRLLLEDPAQFMVLSRVYDMLTKETGLPDTLVNQYAREKGNITIRRGKDKDGNPTVYFGTVTGFIAQQDLRDALTAPFWTQQLGPLVKAAIKIAKERDDIEADRWWQQLGRELGTRPWTSIENWRKAGDLMPGRGGLPARHAPEWFGPGGAGWQLVSPMALKEVPFEQARRVAEAKRKAELAKARGIITKARRLLRMAQLDQSGASVDDLPYLQGKVELYQERERQLRGLFEQQRAEEEQRLKVYRAP